MAKPEPIKESRVDIASGIDTTVMAIRENIMDYYKGNVERLTQSNITTVEMRGHYRYHFQRDDVEMTRETMLRLDGISIINLKQQPDRLTFYATLDRSRSFRAVKEGVNRFMEKYLPGVTIEQDPDKYTDGWRQDRKRVMANANPRTQQPDEDQMDRDIIAALTAHPNFRNREDGHTHRLQGREYIVSNGQWIRRVYPIQRPTHRSGLLTGVSDYLPY